MWAPRRGCVRRSRARTPPLVASRATRTREEAKGESVGSVSPDMFSSDLETTLMRSSPPLHRAARWGDVVSVKSLLREGADGVADTAVDEKDRNGSTPLMWAAQFGHDDVVDVLLANGADPRVTNAFGWTAAEYASTSSVAGDILPLLLAAEPSLLGARRTVPRDMLGGGHGCLVCDFDQKLVAAGPKGIGRFAALASGLVKRYRQSAGQSAEDMWAAPNSVDTAGVAVAGCTFKPLGLYAGQRYEVRRLFYRSPSDGAEADVASTSDPSPRGFDPDAELIATLHNPTWTPWGASEVGVNVAELRSVREELRWAISVAAFAGSFWLTLAFVLSNDLVSLTSVPSESMAPGVHRGDLMLVDRRAKVDSRAVGEVVLFEPPPALKQIAVDNGTPLQRGEYFVKRVVAVAGDVVEVRAGTLYRNGTRESSYPTGTPVGVGELSSQLCEACKYGKYDLGPSTVPKGSVLVLGDNRGGSNDGHVWGYLPEENVLGRITFRVAPLDRAGFLREAPLGEVRVK